MVILKVVTSQDSWIWHVFFGAPGFLNDVDVLNMSPIFNSIYEGSASNSSFKMYATM